MGYRDASRQEMVNFKKFWYNLVAQSLVFELERRKTDHDNLHVRYVHMVGERDKALRTTGTEDMKFAKEIMNLRTKVRSLEQQDPTAASLDSARHNAAQARIRDLEGQLRRNKIEPQ